MSLADQRNKLGLVTGIAPFNLVVNDHSRVVLDQLQGATKLHRLIEFALHNGPGLGIKERNDPLRDVRFPASLSWVCSTSFSRELDGLAKLLFELARRRCRQVLESLTALGQRVAGQLGYFLEDLFALGFALFGLGLRTGSPAGQGFLGGSHMADNLLPQRTRRTS